MSDDFDWSTDNEDIVQHSVRGVAAYVNGYGNITIRQERNWDEDQDTIVVLTLESARALSRSKCKMLHIDNLHATVAGKPIVKGLLLTVNAGEIHAIRGPSGEGQAVEAKQGK